MELTQAELEEAIREGATVAVNGLLGRLEHVGWIDQYGQIMALAMRNGSVPSDRKVYVLNTDRLDV